MIRVGIGGWTYEPWRGPFYPAKHPHARELEYASRQLTAIEINGTFYGSQKPESFRRWAEETPEDFVFSVKGPRFAVNRRVLAEAGPSIERFYASGVTELGPKLGPVLWQFAATKKYEETDFAAFLELLPREAGGLALRHVVEPRHDSFLVPGFVDLLRRFSVAAVVADSDKYPLLADVTADFVYARLQRTREDEPTGYPPAELDRWAARFRTWSEGGEPDDLPLLAAKRAPKKQRPCFVFMISGAKVRAPAAAMALIERVQR
jgi:uncharacterized protein YecE (DUF72 family)